MQILVLRVQKEHKGIPYTVIYRDYVEARFRISYATFNNWLGIPAKRELEKLDKQDDYECKTETTAEV
ncbi:MAG TPA: hypothetical protein DEG28_00970 [Porphyromonadaceae bacterium]|nr:hypothetical protein [Porphyromonadaceae bacterium]